MISSNRSKATVFFLGRLCKSVHGPGSDRGGEAVRPVGTNGFAAFSQQESETIQQELVADSRSVLIIFYTTEKLPTLK